MADKIYLNRRTKQNNNGSREVVNELLFSEQITTPVVNEIVETPKSVVSKSDTATVSAIVVEYAPGQLVLENTAINQTPAVVVATVEPDDEPEPEGVVETVVEAPLEVVELENEALVETGSVLDESQEEVLEEVEETGNKPILKSSKRRKR